MSYTVQCVRCTYECDACGLVQKYDADAGGSAPDWKVTHCGPRSWLCCPACTRKVEAVLKALPLEPFAHEIQLGIDDDVRGVRAALAKLYAPEVRAAFERLVSRLTEKP